MTDTFVKIPSSQGGQFTATNNLLDFRMENNDSYDLSESFLEFNTDISGVVKGVDEGANAQSIYSLLPIVKSNDSGGGAGENLHHGNEVLVKNCYFLSDSAGKMEEIRRGDALYNNLHHYLKDEDEQISDSYKGMTGVVEDGGDCVSGGLYQNLNGFGNVESSNTSHTLKLPLKSIMELGNVENYSVAKYGRSQLHLELNLDKVSVLQRLDKTNVANQFAQNDRNKFDDIVGGAVNAVSITSFRTQKEYPNLRNSPFWVGQALLISGTNGGGAGALADTPVKITNIAYATNGYSLTHQTNGDTTQSKKLIITTSPAITLSAGAGHQYTAITCKGADADLTNAKFNVNSVNLVLKRLSNPPPASPINYTTYTTEEDILPNGSSHFSKVYTVEADAVNLLVCFPQSIQSCMNGHDQLTYRIMVDNIAIHDRDIKTDTSEHYDNISKFFQNQGKIVKNLQDKYLKADGTSGNSRSNQRSSSKLLNIAIPLPQTAQPKLVQLIIDSDANFTNNNIILYKEVVKSI